MTRDPKMRPDGEFGLIARLAERLSHAAQPRPAGAEVHLGIGDDAAVTAPAGVTVTSTEALMEGVHFRNSSTDGVIRNSASSSTTVSPRSRRRPERRCWAAT